MTEIAEEYYATNYEKCRNNESNYFNNCYKKENDLYMVGWRNLTMACTETFEL